MNYYNTQLTIFLKIGLLIGLFFMTKHLNAQDCNNIQYSGIDNQLSITNLTAPIEIIDVFNKDWQSVFQCQGTDCGDQLTIPNLEAGLYHINVKLYTADWQFICRANHELEVSNGNAGNCDKIYQGDLRLGTQAEVDAFAAQGYCEITGNLSIGLFSFQQTRSDITSLLGLNQLTSIGGSLIIDNNPIASLDGLNNIISIGEGIVISKTLVASLEPLKNINSVLGGTLSIFNNDALTSLRGLTNITSVGGGLVVVSNDALTSLSGLDNISTVDSLLLIRGNSGLNSLDGLNRLNVVGGEIFNISDNNALTSCCAIQDLLTNGSINGEISIQNNATGCDSQTEISAFCNNTPPSGDCDKIYQGDIILSTQAEVNAFLTQGYCAITGTLTIGIVGNVGTSDINTLTGLRNLVKIGGGLTITNNDNLSTLTGLDKLNAVGEYITIGGNNGLTALTGLESITSVDKLTILDNSALPSFVGLDNLISVGDFFIQEGANLNSFSGLENLTLIGNLSIVGTSNLITLAGLENLTSINGDFLIGSNHGLTSLTGLEKLTAVDGQLIINDNTVLSSCCAIQHLLANGGVGGGINISNNQTGCDSEAEIVTSCDNTPGDCKDVNVVGTSGGFFEVSNIPTGAKLEYFGPSTSYGLITICDGNCGSIQTIDNLTDGEYTVKVQSFNPYCYAEYKVPVADDTCLAENGDSDRDGICDNQDNCPNTYNPDQVDSDGNGIGDACQTNQRQSELICPENIIVETDDPSGAIVTWDDPQIIAGTICLPGSLERVDGLPKGSKFPVGETEVQYTIFDNGPPDACQNFIPCFFTVLVKYTGEEEDNRIQCEEISLTYTSNSIEMTGQSNENYFFKVHDLNNNWAEVFSCAYQCGSSQTANNLSNGRYLVKVFDESWAVICEQEINLGASSRNRFTNLETFTVYPNPAEEAIFMDLQEYAGESADIAISNIYGQVAHTQHLAAIPTEPFKIPLTNYLNGFYLLHVKMKGKQLRSEKFLVKNLY